MKAKRTKRTTQTVWSLKSIASFATSILRTEKPDNEVYL